MSIRNGNIWQDARYNAGQTNASTARPEPLTKRLDEVNGSPHYRAPNGMEAIDVIEAFGLNFNLGNAVKYLLRAGRKGDALTDLRKAAWYIARELEKTGPQEGKGSP